MLDDPTRETVNTLVACIRQLDATIADLTDQIELARDAKVAVQRVIDILNRNTAVMDTEYGRVTSDHFAEYGRTN